MSERTSCPYCGSPDLRHEQVQVGARLVEAIACGNCETWIFDRCPVPEPATKAPWRLPASALVDVSDAGQWEVDAPGVGMVDGFASRREAEAWAVAHMEEELRDKGEATQEQCRILQVVATVVEVVGATRDDGSEMAAWLKERGLDYEVKHYRVKPAS